MRDRTLLCPCLVGFFSVTRCLFEPAYLIFFLEPDVTLFFEFFLRPAAYVSMLILNFLRAAAFLDPKLGFLSRTPRLMCVCKKLVESENKRDREIMW